MSGSNSGTISGFSHETYDPWLEIASVALIAIATVLSAWCAYQSARWSGVQAKASSNASAYRIEATRLHDFTNSENTVQVSLFVNYWSARTDGRTALSEFLESRFPSPLKEAFEAWILTDPLKNPNAPASPFDMPEYRFKQENQSRKLIMDADAEMRHAVVANEHSDNYVLLTVICASVLFFGGMATKFRARGLRAGFVVAGWVILVAVGIVLGRFPLH